MATYTRIGTVALKQLAFDFAGNRARIVRAIKLAHDAQVNILLFPELAITGYGCEDNFTFQEFNALAESSLQKIIEEVGVICADTSNMVIAVGMPLMFPGGQVFNATAVISASGLHGFSCKQFLARNGLHYEPRWFQPWDRSKVLIHPLFEVPMGDIVVDAAGVRIGFETCEDSWISNRPGRDLYQRNVDVIVNPSASHFAVGKYTTREQFITEGSRAFGVAYAYANLNGTENGTSIFDAGCLIASEGKVVSRGERLNVSDVLLNQTLVNLSANRVNRIVSSEAIRNDDANTVSLSENVSIESTNVDISRLNNNEAGNTELSDFWGRLRADELLYSEICYAIGTGLWDWLTRTKTNGFVVSLSGGADSGLVASLVYFSNILAVRQLGVSQYLRSLNESLQQAIAPPAVGVDLQIWIKEQVMPELLWCLYQGTDNSSETTFDAARSLAKEVGANFFNWNVEPLVQQYTHLVNGMYPGRPLIWETDDVTLQNIQARARSPGVWMVANRENKLLIATSNLSESALGYATMDGDTSGVLSAISGISKSTIRKMLVWLEQSGLPLNWQNGFMRFELQSLKWINRQQPTAELRPNAQTDEDDLMPYEICDFIMDCYLVKQMWPKSILVELMLKGFSSQYKPRRLAEFVERWFKLFCRNPWKRYGTRAGFHVEQISLDPKTFHRFPLLNSGFEEPLALMWEYLDNQNW